MQGVSIFGDDGRRLVMVCKCGQCWRELSLGRMFTAWLPPLFIEWVSKPCAGMPEARRKRLKLVR